MPLSFHDWAKKAASFSSCININYGNESFWKVHDIIFKNQSIITSDKFIDNLRIIIEKNSEDDFAICYDEYQKDKYLSRVEKSIKEAKKLGLNSNVRGKKDDDDVKKEENITAHNSITTNH